MVFSKLAKFFGAGEYRHATLAVVGPQHSIEHDGSIGDKVVVHPRGPNDVILTIRLGDDRAFQIDAADIVGGERVGRVCDASGAHV